MVLGEPVVASFAGTSTGSSSMPLVHGQNISARDIEHEQSRWGAALFARLGNAVAWGQQLARYPNILAFTERVNVADMDGFCADRLSHDSGVDREKADRKNGPSASPYSRDASASPLRPVQEKLAVAESRFGILIDRDDDRLYMVVAIPFQGRLAPHIGKRLDPRRVIGIGIKPLGRLVGHRLSSLSKVGLLAVTDLPAQLVFAKSASVGPRHRDRSAANGARQFGDLRAQLQNPKRHGVILHPMLGDISRSLFSM